MPRLPHNPDRTHLNADDVHALLQPDVEPDAGPTVTGPGLAGVTGGLRPHYVDATEARRRREQMSRMLAGGVSNDAVIAFFMSPDPMPDGSPGFNMSEHYILELIAEVRSAWSDEDRERGKHAKSASIRRHHRHIALAVRKGAFTAVAMLEKNLAQIEGTLVHRVSLEGDAGMTNLLLSVIGDMDPAEARRIVAEETARAKLLPAHAAMDVPPPVRVDAELQQRSRRAVDALATATRPRSQAPKPA